MGSQDLSVSPLCDESTRVKRAFLEHFQRLQYDLDQTLQDPLCPSIKIIEEQNRLIGRLELWVDWITKFQVLLCEEIVLFRSVLSVNRDVYRVRVIILKDGEVTDRKTGALRRSILTVHTLLKKMRNQAAKECFKDDSKIFNIE